MRLQGIPCTYLGSLLRCQSVYVYGNLTARSSKLWRWQNHSSFRLISSTPCFRVMHYPFNETSCMRSWKTPAFSQVLRPRPARNTLCRRFHIMHTLTLIYNHNSVTQPCSIPPPNGRIALLFVFVFLLSSTSYYTFFFFWLYVSVSYTQFI